PARPSVRARGSALGAVVEQARQQELGVITPARRVQAGDNVETVAAIGDRHRVEEAQERLRNPSLERIPLAGLHPGQEVCPELAHLRRPPGRAAGSLGPHCPLSGMPVMSETIGRPTWAKTSWSGPWMPVRSGMKIRASRTYGPYWARIGPNSKAWRGGSAASNTRAPSSGGTGIRLKMNRATLISTKISRTFRTPTWPGLDATFCSTRKTTPPITAMTRFDTGPAAATIASPVRPLRRFAKLTGVGLAQPIPTPAEVARRRVAQPVGHPGMEELMDRERDQDDDRGGNERRSGLVHLAIVPALWDLPPV